MGQPGGYTSYDYGAVIAEDRSITREKYSELKLIANFLKVSSSYITATPGDFTNATYTSTSALTVTPLIGRLSNSSFFVVRHSEYASRESTDYRLHLPTSAGSLTIPQLGGSLTLHGRDSKIHVTDYNVSGSNILYSTAEIFTWKKFEDKKVLVIYGGPNERHELAVSMSSKATLLEGEPSELQIKSMKDYVVVNWQKNANRRIVRIDDLLVFLLGNAIRLFYFFFY